MSVTTLSKTPSPLQLREELEAKVLKELLGPGSEEEVILESPGTCYHVGMPKPRKKARGEGRGKRKAGEGRTRAILVIHGLVN
jgi:hypothetical protein